MFEIWEVRHGYGIGTDSLLLRSVAARGIRSKSFTSPKQGLYEPHMCVSDVPQKYSNVAMGSLEFRVNTVKQFISGLLPSRVFSWNSEWGMWGEGRRWGDFVGKRQV